MAEYYEQYQSWKKSITIAMDSGSPKIQDRGEKGTGKQLMPF
jgi:hypothetical protein